MFRKGKIFKRLLPVILEDFLSTLFIREIILSYITWLYLTVIIWLFARIYWLVPYSLNVIWVIDKSNAMLIALTCIFVLYDSIVIFQLQLLSRLKRSCMPIRKEHCIRYCQHVHLLIIPINDGFETAANFARIICRMQIFIFFFFIYKTTFWLNFFRSFPHHQNIRLFHGHFKVNMLKYFLPIFSSCSNLIWAGDRIQNSQAYIP